MSVPRVHIKGLGNNGNKDEIRRLFSEFGQLKNVWIATKPPGFAYVFYENFDDADKAVAYFDNKEVCGKIVSVELSPIEDKYKQREEGKDGDPEEAEGGSAGNESNTSNYEEVEDVYYESDPDTKQDYERERFHESNYRPSSRGRRDDRKRNGPPNYRGRPYDRQRGGRRGGHFSNFRDRDDNRRQSFPDRRGSRGRGRGGYDNREHGREMYRDAGSPRGYRQRGRDNGRPNYEDRYGGSRSRDGVRRMSDNYSNPPGNYEHGRGRRGRSEFSGHDRFRGGNRGHEHRPQYERNRPEIDRFHSPPPPPRRTLGPSSHKRTLGSPVSSEFVAREYRMRRNEAKNGRHSDREFIEGMRSIDSRQSSDMEYRQRRKMARDEQWTSREKEYYKRPPDLVEYEKYSPKKRYRHSEKVLLTRDDYPHQRSRRSLDEGYHQSHRGVDSYRREKYSSISMKPWETNEVRDRSPHISPQTRYLDHYDSPSPPPPQAYAYSNLHREESRSRSRSVSSHVETSDTSRGPSASPSPPHHKQTLLYRTPSRSRSRSLSPMLGISSQYDSEYQPRGTTQQELGSPPYSRNSPVFRSPSPTFAPRSPPYVPNSPGYHPHSPIYAPLPSPGIERHIEQNPRHYSKEKRQVEFDRKKGLRGEYENKKGKREVRNRDRERKISYNEKRASDRFIEVGSKQPRHSSEKRDHGRPLSESFDTFVGSSSSRHISPPPPPPSHPPQRRSRTSPRRKRSGHLEEYVTM